MTEAREIGVDVEWVRKDFSFDEVADRFVTSREVAALNALPPRLQRKAKEQFQTFLSSSLLSMMVTWRRWSWTALNLGSHIMRGNRRAKKFGYLTRDWLRLV